jgi:hypothetical protein
MNRSEQRRRDAERMSGRNNRGIASYSSSRKVERRAFIPRRVRFVETKRSTTTRENFRDVRFEFRFWLVAGTRDLGFTIKRAAAPFHPPNGHRGSFTLRECTGFSISTACMALHPEEALVHLSHLRSSRRLAERETHLPESRCLNPASLYVQSPDLPLALARPPARTVQRIALAARK